MIEVVSSILVCISIVLAERLTYLHLSHLQISILLLIAIGAIMTSIGIFLNKASQVVIWTLLVSITIFRAIASMPPPTLPQDEYVNKKVVVEGIIDQRPDSSNTDVKIILTKTTLVHTNQTTQWTGKIAASLPLYSNVHYGDLVKVSGKLIDLHKINPGYANYLRHQNVYGQIEYGNAQIISHNHGSKLIEWAIGAQQAIENSVFKQLPRDDAALLLGVVAGLPENMSSAYADALKNTSTTHIIVASGYNLTILMTLTMKLSPRIGKRKTILLSFIPIICYILISGAQPSIIRAGVVALIAAIGTILGRQKDSIVLLAITCLVMLMYNPLWVYDPSFQLSFTATLGILLFQPSLNKIIRLPHWLKETAGTTAAAQIGVMPIIIGTFQSISVIGILVNMLVLWIIPWIMAGGAILILINLVLPTLGNFAALAIEPALLYVRYCIALFGHLPFVVVHTGINLFSIIVYLVLVIWLLLQREKHNETLA